MALTFNVGNKVKVTAYRPIKDTNFAKLYHNLLLHKKAISYTQP